MKKALTYEENLILDYTRLCRRCSDLICCSGSSWTPSVSKELAEVRMKIVAMRPQIDELRRCYRG